MQAGDLIAGLCATACAELIWTAYLHRAVERGPHAAQALVLCCLWVVGLKQLRVSDRLVHASMLDDLPFLLRTILMWGMVATLLFAVINGDPDGASFTIIAVGLGLVVFPATRSLTSHLLRSSVDGPRRRALVVGAGSVGVRIAHLLQTSPHSRVDVVGFLDSNPLHDTLQIDGVGRPVFGGIGDVRRVIQEQQIDLLIIAFSSAQDRTTINLIWDCDKLGVKVAIVPRLFEAATVRNVTEVVGGVPLIHADRVRLRGANLVAKRVFDLVVTTLALVPLWPLLLLVAVIVRIESPGPVLFRQKRVGVDGHVFTIYKFRSMRPDAHVESTWTTTEDPRRTRFGRIIRWLNIDELPQLFNVLKGDMSLVGPRPEQVSYVRQFEESIYRYSYRHTVRSGLTGWAQVNGLRGDTSIQDRVMYDIHYIENWSFWLDVKIMLLTLLPSRLPSMEKNPPSDRPSTLEDAILAAIRAEKMEDYGTQVATLSGPQ